MAAKHDLMEMVIWWRRLRITSRDPHHQGFELNDFIMAAKTGLEYKKNNSANPPADSQP